jgi:hypothetical protein
VGFSTTAQAGGKSKIVADGGNFSSYQNECVSVSESAIYRAFLKKFLRREVDNFGDNLWEDAEPFETSKIGRRNVNETARRADHFSGEIVVFPPE